MKKSLSLLVMLSVTMLAVAQTFTWSSYSYTITKAPSGNLRGECQLNGLASGESVSGAIEITPSVAYNGSYYNVTSVKASAFAGNDKITAVRFPYGMRTIGSASFQKCTKLVSVYVPSSVTSIGSWAFNGCSAFKNFYTAQSHQGRVNYGESVFPVNSGMKAYFPNGDIWPSDEQERLFGIERSVLAYDMYMVDGTVSVVETPATRAGDTHKCTIVGFNPNGSQVSSATTYEPSNAISSPSGYEFRFEYTKIGKHAFMDSEIKSAQLKNLTSLTTIGDEAFYNSKLGAISLPKNLTTMGQAVFRHTVLLTQIQLSSENTNFWLNDGILYGKDAAGNRELVCVPPYTVRHTINVQPVHTIREYAFQNFQWSNSAIKIPYGLKEIRGHAFENTNIHSYLNIPSSVTVLYPDWMCNCWFTKDAEFVMNISNKTIMSAADLTTNVGIDAGAKLYVPREAVADYKASKTWSKFTSVNLDYKTAYDFKLNAYYTVTSSNKTTINGTNYDGTLKVVHGMGSLNAKIAVNATSNEGKVYAPTRIDTDAFRGTSVTDIDLDNTVSSFATDALSNASLLKNVTLLNTAGTTWDGKFFGNNATGFIFWVRNDIFNGFYTSALKNWDMGSGKTGIDFLAPYIQSTYDNTTFSCAVPVTFSGSGLNAYYVTSGTGNTLNTSIITSVAAGTGVVVTGINKGEIYRLPRATSGSNPVRNLLAGVPGTKVDVFGVDGGYIWNTDSKKFIRPSHSGNYALSGTSYLKIPSSQQAGYQEYYLNLWPAPAGKKGDVNGDGEVDITDANILINVILGKDKASNYNGRADVDGNGEVDITDANEVINIILGKGGTHVLSLKN